MLWSIIYHVYIRVYIQTQLCLPRRFLTHAYLGCQGAFHVNCTRIYADSYYNYNYSDFRKSTPEISGVEYMESTLAWLHHCSAFLPHFDIYNWLFFRNIEDILKEKQEIVKKVLDDESVEIVTKQILKDNNENT